MWLFLNNAFVSVVAQRRKTARDFTLGAKPAITARLLVRARFEGDIERALGVAVKVSVTTDSDYRYRAVVTRRTFRAALRLAVSQIDYVNFKDSIDKNDPARKSAYMGVWTEMWRAQSRAHPPRGLELGRDPWDRLMGDRWDYRYRDDDHLLRAEDRLQGRLPFELAGEGICPDCGCELTEGFCEVCGFDLNPDDDEGCPVGDPDCLSRADECHDACEAPASTTPAQESNDVTVTR